MRLCGDTLQQVSPQMTNIKWRMRFPWCTTKATNTHLQYVIVIALPQQNSLRERASVLRYMNIPFLANFYHSKDILFWLLRKVHTSDRPRFTLLVCSLININFTFANITCLLTPSPRNTRMVCQYILKYTLLLLYLMSYIKHVFGNIQSTGLGNLYGNNK
jgi:hypothetical protein